VIRLLVWILLGYAVYLMFKGRSDKKELPKERPSGEEAHRDPVCGVFVAEEDAVIGKLEGERLYFCSMACLEKYREQLTHKSET
jgi:YHS domain-containing protein